jgi:transposase
MIKEQGFQGRYGIVALYVQRLRRAAAAVPLPGHPAPSLRCMTAAPLRPLTPRRATWLVLRAPDRCTEEDQQLMARLTAQAPALAEAVTLAQDFASLVRQRQPEALDAWLARATTSPLMPFRRFAKGLRADYAAVQAAVTLPWSQGPIEGHINRLKMLKRQMFSRASLDLLARRFLLTA